MGTQIAQCHLYSFLGLAGLRLKTHDNLCELLTRSGTSRYLDDARAFGLTKELSFISQPRPHLCLSSLLYRR